MSVGSWETRSAMGMPKASTPLSAMPASMSGVEGLQVDVERLRDGPPGHVRRRS